MEKTIEILRIAALLGFFIAFMAYSSDEAQDVTGSAEELAAAGVKISARGTNVVVVQGTDNFGKGF